MTAIIVMPRSHGYYGGGLCSHFGDSAVRDQSRQQADQHREVMGALRDLRKDTITVAVLSSAVLPLCNAALEKLEGPARDYDAALGVWQARVWRVRSWQYTRRKTRANRRKQEKRQEYIAAYITKHSRWWRSAAWTQRKAEVAADSCWEICSYSDRYLSRPNYDEFRDSLAATRPRVPAGYDDLPAIQDLKSAASMAADAQLTVPVETVKRLMRWAP